MPAPPQQQQPAAGVQPPARKRKATTPLQGPPKKRQLLGCQGLVLKVLEAKRPAGLTRAALVTAMRGEQDTMFPSMQMTETLRQLTEQGSRVNVNPVITHLY